MLDFKAFPKIDAHFHSTEFDLRYIKIAKDQQIKFLNINTDAVIFPSIAQQESVALRYIKEAPQHFAYLTTFSMNGWQKDGWIESALHRIRKSLQSGASGIKIWKNIGMEIRKEDGTFLMIDDPLFTPLFKFLAQNKIPVLAHLGEPRNCWLPIDEMNSERNKRYYINNPEFYAYLHPEIPSYEKQIEAKDYILKSFPDLTLVGAHLGTIEWNYRELAKRFDRFSNFKVDISSRLGHLQIQSIKDWEGVRDFFINYADRILYGTDAYNNMDKLIHALLNDWLFLSTHTEVISNEVAGRFLGIQLPEEVLYKIYYKNAKDTYHL